MERLQPRIQHYAWGSHEVIARLTGRPWPTREPEAELWFGAHEAAPSALRDGQTLNDAVAADPAGILGTDVVEAFGGRFPFLLKVLAPVAALSIQAHPTAIQAAAAPSGTYADGWPKPEALVALTDFEIFAGTRDFADTWATADRLGIDPLRRHLEAVADAPEPTRAYLARLLHLPAEEQASLADAVVAAARRDAPEDPALDALVRIADQHPSDVGLVVLLSMRHRVLRQGEYAFVAAGVLHAYVRGVAVEIMSNSDNIVRAGLTRKQIDVGELLRIVDLERVIEPVAAEQCDGWAVFPAATSYFRLWSAHCGDQALAVPGPGQPRILLALDGTAELISGRAKLTLAPGEAAFLSAGDHWATVTGSARVFLATPGEG